MFKVKNKDNRTTPGVELTTHDFLDFLNELFKCNPAIPMFIELLEK